MHIHIYVKLGFWQRLGILLTLLSGLFVAITSIHYIPTQADIAPCLMQLENPKIAVAAHQEALKTCHIEIIKSAVKVQQTVFISKILLIWLGVVLAVYLISFLASWVRAGETKK